MAAPQIKLGTLVQLLKGVRLQPIEVHAVFPDGPRLSTKVRALVDYLVQNLKYAAASLSRMSPSRCRRPGRAVVANHGGSILLKPTDRGAVFELQFPAA